MDDEARCAFARAEALFQAGDFQGSLGLLESLDVQYPNNRNILYPLALCNMRLGRREAARQLCQRLVGEFIDQRAQKLLAELNAAEPEVPLEIVHTGLAHLTDKETVPVVEASEVNAPLWRRLFIAFGMLIIVMLLAAPLFRSAPAIETGVDVTPATESIAADTTFDEQGNPASPVLMYILGALLRIPVYTATLYLALHITGNLLAESLLHNLIHTTMVATMASIVGLVPVVGFVFAVLVIKHAYDLDLVELFFLGITFSAIDYLFFQFFMLGRLLDLAGSIAS